MLCSVLKSIVISLFVGLGKIDKADSEGRSSMPLGTGLTAAQPWGPLPHEFSGVAQKKPFEVPTITFIVADVLEPLHPVGSDHVYEVAPVEDAV